MAQLKKLNLDLCVGVQRHIFYKVICWSHLRFTVLLFQLISSVLIGSFSVSCTVTALVCPRLVHLSE